MTDPTLPGRRERKRQQQLDHLADTAWTLFEADGYEAVTMERIAAAADVAKATLYKHFPVKEALLRHRFHRELRAVWPALQAELAQRAPGRERLAHFLARQADWCERQRGYLTHYVRHRLATLDLLDDGRERSGMDLIFTALIADGQAAGAFRTDLPAAQLAMHFQFVHLATLLRWLGGGARPLADEMAAMLDLVCGGMEARP